MAVERRLRAELSRGRDCDAAKLLEGGAAAVQGVAALPEDLGFAEDDRVQPCGDLAEVLQCCDSRPSGGRRAVAGRARVRLDALTAAHDRGARVSGLGRALHGGDRFTPERGRVPAARDQLVEARERFDASSCCRGFPAPAWLGSPAVAATA